MAARATPYALRVENFFFSIASPKPEASSAAAKGPVEIAPSPADSTGDGTEMVGENVSSPAASSFSARASRSAIAPSIWASVRGLP